MVICTHADNENALSCLNTKFISHYTISSILQLARSSTFHVTLTSNPQLARSSTFHLLTLTLTRHSMAPPRHAFLPSLPSPSPAPNPNPSPRPERWIARCTPCSTCEG